MCLLKKAAGENKKLQPPLLFSRECDIFLNESGGSSNGRTDDSDSSSLGSNPSPPANPFNNEKTAVCGLFAFEDELLGRTRLDPGEGSFFLACPFGPGF